VEGEDHVTVPASRFNGTHPYMIKLAPHRMSSLFRRELERDYYLNPRAYINIPSDDKSANACRLALHMHMIHYTEHK